MIRVVTIVFASLATILLIHQPPISGQASTIKTSKKPLFAYDNIMAKVFYEAGLQNKMDSIDAELRFKTQKLKAQQKVLVKQSNTIDSLLQKRD